MKLIIPDAPDWFQKAAREIEDGFVSRLPKVPTKLAFYESNALPLATKYRGHLIWVNDLNLTATSNGSTWITSTGVSL